MKLGPNVPSTIKTKATFDVVLVSDVLILLNDCSKGCSVTNDAEAVIRSLSSAIGGIGLRRVFFRDPNGSFDELVVYRNAFIGFRPGTPGQQVTFQSIFVASGCDEEHWF